jgi:hypothetical protein
LITASKEAGLKPPVSDIDIEGADAAVALLPAEDEPVEDEVETLFRVTTSPLALAVQYVEAT